MQATKGKNNPREILIRRALFRIHRGFRLHWPVPGNARRTIDIAFPSLKLAIFLDGCFWHGCSMHRTFPKTNADKWNAKIEQNILRDRETDELLKTNGWSVIRIWGHIAELAAITLISEAISSSHKNLRSK
jgi:DNA mismatch endonuclease (patch repair protein)